MESLDSGGIFEVYIDTRDRSVRWACPGWRGHFKTSAWITRRDTMPTERSSKVICKWISIKMMTSIFESRQSRTSQNFPRCKFDTSLAHVTMEIRLRPPTFPDGSFQVRFQGYPKVGMTKIRNVIGNFGASCEILSLILILTKRLRKRRGANFSKGPTFQWDSRGPEAWRSSFSGDIFEIIPLEPVWGGRHLGKPYSSSIAIPGWIRGLEDSHQWDSQVLL